MLPVSNYAPQAQYQQRVGANKEQALYNKALTSLRLIAKEVKTLKAESPRIYGKKEGSFGLNSMAETVLLEKNGLTSDKVSPDALNTYLQRTEQQIKILTALEQPPQKIEGLFSPKLPSDLVSFKNSTTSEEIKYLKEVLKQSIKSLQDRYTVSTYVKS